MLLPEQNQRFRALTAQAAEELSTKSIHHWGLARRPEDPHIHRRHSRIQPGSVEAVAMVAVARRMCDALVAFA